MTKKKEIIDYGMGECQYRFCNLVDKKFTKKRTRQKYCCPAHRSAEWNLLNPRLNEDAKNQMPIDFVVKKVIIPIQADRYDGNQFFDKHKKRKRSFHYTLIDKKNKRGSILRSTLELLMRTNPTTFEINESTGSTRASSDISELRAQGFGVVCIPCGKSENEIGINRFQLTAEGKQKAVEFFRR